MSLYIAVVFKKSILIDFREEGKVGEGEIDASMMSENH